MIVLIDDEVTELRRIMAEGLLFPVFQPILDFRVRAILGYESLIRGPANSHLQFPDQLFAAAARNGLTLDLEHACREASLRAFAAQRLSGRLFLNVTPGCLRDHRLMNGHTRDLLNELGIAPNRIVIELTENQQITDMPGIQEALLDYRGRGFQFAIDDLGEGFANLRMWSELRPEFVKIDKHFVSGIASDRIKFHFVRAMQDLAEICNALLVAEGIECSEDLLCLRDMGIACGQGYFIARPERRPIRQLAGQTLVALGHQSLALSPLTGGPGKVPTARTLARLIEPVPMNASNGSVIARFEADPDLDVLPVVHGHQPVGMINRHSMIDRFARPFRKELFGRRSCELFMDHAPLVVDQHATIQELAMMLALAPKHYLFDGFIVTADGQYIGVGSSHDLMGTITEMQISAARYANPLTQLPGNVPINEHVDRMLQMDNPFVAAYIDIDNFKPYNDAFGYRRGDDVIQTLARLICEACDQKVDFVGHIGGDDFFVIFRSEDWEVRCWQIISAFSQAMANMLGVEERLRGGYMAENRRGELSFQALPTLSIGAVKVASGDCESHREVAAAASAAKKQAKKKGRDPANEPLGGSLFVERRRVAVADVAPAPVRYMN
ncbi:GGDEF domain-containing protein [Dechloromonas sp. HYN0024]|uniref:GGDEF domain-containing protein n=1 Tax=Dechloromonas sp. HYN0024 TaxID=2231055 RepID=UPI000E444126|nr:GGDEF domain-containing protein [Dechloromonas sp. HYN0024]AXS80901.1 GGDEF domain-containing protein [Dechloromonas sp. HYN0024]